MATGGLFSNLSAAAWRLFGPSREDRAAGFELAVSTRHFARRTKRVVDDKLSFSATLMRAGEVEAANRLLSEVEDDVLAEEAALMERVAEVKVARSLERPPTTRVRLARALAVAMLGSAVLASSAVGMAVVGLFRDEGAEVVTDAGARSQWRAGLFEARTANALRNVWIAGVRLALSPSEFSRLDELTRGEVDKDRLETFLLGLLPPPLAEKVSSALVLASETIPPEIEEPMIVASARVNQERKKANEESQKAQGAADDEEQPSPSDSESPSPSESGDDEGDDDGGLPILGNSYQ